MILSDRDLVAAIERGALKVIPKLGPGSGTGRPAESQIQPNSIDLLLGDSLQRPTNLPGLLNNGLPTRLKSGGGGLMGPMHNLPLGAELRVEPGDFLLGVTDEWIEVDPEHTAAIEGLSSIGRLGLLVHMAGRVDAGYKGRLTLELKNLAPWTLVLEVGQPIAQLVVSTLSSPCLRPYGDRALGSRYQNLAEAAPARPNQRAYVGTTARLEDLATFTP